MSNEALSGIRIIELGTMVSGPYCGKLLADLGANVVKVESRSGDPARHRGPFPGGEPHPERSALFLYHNTNKRSIVLDLTLPDDIATLDTLLAGADVLIDNHPAALLESAGLGWSVLRQRNPRLVYTHITPYGRTGPRRDVNGDELTLIHAGGLGNLLPTRSRDVDRAPVKLGGYGVGTHGGLVAAVATLAALHGREATGRGTLVDVSLQEVILALMAPVVAGSRYHHLNWSRVPDRPPAMGRMQTKDGWVILNAFDDHHFQALVDLMGRPDWCSGDEWKSLAYRSEHLMEIADRIDEWVSQQEKHELHRLAGERGIPIGPIENARDVLESRQYAARDYFVSVPHPEAGTLRYPGWPYHLSATPPQVRHAAPRLGEHQDNLSLIGPTTRESSTSAPATATGSAPRRERASTSDSPLPLAGVRVIEMCWVWAGPYAGRLLAALGAEVLKVESHRRTDLTRRSVVWPQSDPAPSTVPSSQGMSFNSVNLGKKSVTIDLAKPEGVELVRRLAKVSDVVMDNLRPGALEKLGLGHQSLRELNPRLVVASSSGRGYGGPDSEYLGYAMVHQGIGGGAHITGYPDGPPSHSGGDVDLMNAIAFAYAILASLWHRQRSGEGQVIDFSQCEGVTSLLGEVILDFQMSGTVPGRHGNADPEHAPHAVYRAWGVDRWVAIEVHGDEEWKRLAEVLGQPELAADPRFASASARKANEAELDAIIEAWTRERDRDRTVRDLTRAGVTAAPSRNAADLYADPHLKARRAFVEVQHPELGPLELVDVPWKVEDWATASRPAPLLGEHTEEVLRELLGLSETELQSLRERDVIL